MTQADVDAPLRRPRDLHERDRRLPSGPSPRLLQWLIVVLLVAGVASLVVKGADQPPDPYLRAGRQPVAGFGEIAYRVNRTPDADRCALLAQSAMQHAQGLIGVDDLGGYDGLMFVHAADTTLPLTTRGVSIPLSIAWFDAGGRFLGATEAEPCLERAECPEYAAPSPYRYALQVPRGGLEPLGVGAGAVISVGGPCA